MTATNFVEEEEKWSMRERKAGEIRWWVFTLVAIPVAAIWVAIAWGFLFAGLGFQWPGR